MYFFAFLDAELVAKGLLTRTNDAIAVGQFTPGPVFSSVTLWAIKSMESQGIHFYAGDIPTLICVCCPIESYGKKNEKL
jgi:chromate transporter